MGYRLHGLLAEACTCDAICPCWIGEDPDGGTCDGTIAWHFENGEIDGVDVSGLSFAILVHIPGNALAGNWRVVACVDDRATDEQEKAILSVYTGAQGGPVADFAQLIGEVAAVERMPMTIDMVEGKGQLKIGSSLDAEVNPLQSLGGKRTTLQDAVFSVIEGAPYYVGKTRHLKASHPAIGLNLDIAGKSAVQGKFAYEA